MCPITNATRQIYTGAFTDDLIRIYALPEGPPHARWALAVDYLDNITLNKYIHMTGHRQNIDKQDALVYTTNARVTRDIEHRIAGTKVYNLIHLGGLISPTGSNYVEVRARIQSAAVGWTRLGNYWLCPGPWKYKRSTFITNVAGRAWSALESYVLAPTEYNKLNVCLAKKCVLCCWEKLIKKGTTDHSEVGRLIKYFVSGNSHRPQWS